MCWPYVALDSLFTPKNRLNRLIKVITQQPCREREEQGSKSPFFLLSEPISPSSLLFEPISPSSLNVYLTFSPSSQLFFGPFLPPPYSVPPPSVHFFRVLEQSSSQKKYQYLFESFALDDIAWVK